MQKKKVIVLGSTGSIGRQAFALFENTQDFEVLGVSAGGSIDILEEQIRAFNIPFAAVWDEDKGRELQTRVKEIGTTVFFGEMGMQMLIKACAPALVLNAVVGMVGLLPTITAIEHGCDIALANKETLVTGGTLVMDLVKKHNVKMMPVDSEHSAIFQCLEGNDPDAVDHLMLTASGGAFFGWDKARQRTITKAMALRHPTWNMGAKISIDSATLMNKGLELIEAMHLFQMPAEKIKVVVHPQSIVHSMVAYVDGSVMAQLSTPDMTLPIGYALYYPQRKPLPTKPLDLITAGTLQFFEPDVESFTCLKLAMQCAKKLGTATAVLNGANEEAVSLFLNEAIGFTQISDLVEMALDAHTYLSQPTIEQILEADKNARIAVRNAALKKL